MMAHPFKYKNGDQFGDWTLLYPNGRTWRAKCKCGNEKDVFITHLVKGKSKSCMACGALRRTSHGLTRTPTYQSWAHMRSRCFNLNDDRYHQYGGRGITICAEWEDFANFLKDMGKRPEGTSLDRVDVDGNYEPTNCRWATPTEQSRNLRVHKDKYCITELAEKIGIPHGTLRSRLNRGWDYDTAVSTPVNDKTQSVCAQARARGLPEATVLCRINRGWTLEKALSTPVKAINKQAIEIQL